MTDLKSSLHFHENHHQALNALDQVVLESFPSWVNNSQVQPNQAQPRARKNWEFRPSAKSRLSNSPIDKSRTRLREEAETYGPSNQLMQNISNDEIQIPEKKYKIRTKSRDRGSPERNNEGSFIGSEASFTSSNFLRTSQKNEQVPNRLSNATLSPREIDDHIILSPLGSQYRTLTPIGEVNEQGSLTIKSIQQEQAKIFGDPNLVTIAASSRRISITQANSDSPQPYSGRKKADDAKNMRRRGSEKKQFAEDEYCKIMMQQQHPNLVVDLDDDDDVINKSLSYVLTINKEEGNSINTRKIDQHEEPKELGEPIQKNSIDAEITTIAPVKAQPKQNSRKQMEAYAKIQEPQIQLQLEEEETKIENKSHRKAISKLVQASDLQSDANGALLKKAEPTLSNKKKKKESRFNSLFFKKQSTYRTGIPTLTEKNRFTNDILNLEKIGINSKKGRRISAVRANFSDGEKSDAIGQPTTTKLMEVFENIQMHRLFKQKMEMFILLFNKDPEKGINFLIENELIDDTPEKIAAILVTTEGLNKDMIGKYLGSHKEKHVKVLKAYCNSLDFSNLEFDHALRLLLSRFKLPGEAWQIERVVQMFADVYHKDNPNTFVDADTPYILSYSLLMLNTDAHSDNIPKNKKMTRTQFVTNNLKVCKGITAEYLGMMYDNIIKSKFETRTDYIEQMYSRLQLDSNKLLLQGETIKMAMDTANELIKGAVFIKYGRMGKPHERHVRLSAAEDRVLWKKPFKPDSSAKSIFLHDITNVYVGSSSTKVLRQKKAPFELDNVIFSLETSKRTLDLRAPDLETRTKWEGYFRQQLLHRKQKEDEITLKMKDRSSKDRERISEIWKTDILPNFHYHWNYESHRPRNQDDLEHSKNRKSNGPKLYRAAVPKTKCSWKTLLCCFCFKSDSESHVPLNSSQTKSSRIKIEEGATEQDELRLIWHNKSILLYHVWRLGIPDWLRKTIWPITIGNRLEITPNLYQVLLLAAEAFKGDDEKFENIAEYRAVMEKDIPETFWELEYFKEPRNRQTLTNVLVAFICYRPDVGYVKGMAHMAAVLVRFCPEYEAFECFVNMTHSYHFISFFRGEMRDVEWRIEMFNQYFKKELPQLYNHFSALDISSEMFLLDWFLSLFSAGLTDLDIIARIWDCFLLDGELFAIKAAVAILKYYELELKMIGFAAATQFLKKPQQIINEKQFFDIIESLNIPSMEYQKTLEKKTVAQINSHIHQALLIS